MKLGKYFTLKELTCTNSGLVNSPNKPELANLKLLVEKILDPLRELYGKPIHINSGYRSSLVNKAVGGAKTSQHVKGQAADITGGDKEQNEILFNLIAENFEFDQLINEKDFSWVHVSYSDTNNRSQKLKFDGKSYTKI